MAQIRQSNDFDLTRGSYIQANEWSAQTFTTLNAYTIIDVKLFGFNNALDPEAPDIGDITVGIYPVDGTGKPDCTGAALTSGTYDGNLLPVGVFNANWFTINITDYALDAATKYALVVSAEAGHADEVVCLESYDVDNYAGGALYESNNAGVGWTEQTDDDLLFLTRSAGLVTADSNVTKRAVFASFSEVWYGDVETPKQLVASIGGIDAETYSLSMFEAYGKAFIVNGTNKKVVDFINHKIQTTDIQGAGSTSYPKHGTIIEGASGAAMVVDYITALGVDDAADIYGKKINSIAFVAKELVSGINLDDTIVKFNIKDGTTEIAPDPPHWYNWTPYGDAANTGTKGFGKMPTKVVAGCNWRGRCTITKDEDNPHQWYMPRQGNPYDWAYISNDAGSPVAGGNSPQAGLIGDDVITSAALSKDYLIFICANSLWYAAGDPAEGGSILELDDTAGGLGDKCWCKDKADNLFIVATSGILKIPKNFGVPENLTEVDYPDFIKDLAYTPGTHTLVVTYDRKRHGINIFKTTIATGVNSCWWFDLRTMGLFPESYPTECGPYCAFYYEAANPDYRELLFGCADGYIRFVDDAAKSDAATGDTFGSPTTAIDSYVTFGPIALNFADKEGSLNSMNIITAGGLAVGSETDSNNVDFKAWTGLSADEVTEKLIVNTSPQIGGTVIAPGRRRGSTIRRKVRGAYFGLRVGNANAGETWGLEKIVLDTKTGGKIK